MQAARVPPRKHLADGRVVHAQAGFQHAVGFGNQLHQAVLDAVVHHLHEVAGRARADVGHAGLGAHVRRNGLEHGLHHAVGLLVAAGHHARAEARAFLAAAHAHAEEVEAACRQGLVAALGVGEVRVAAVDDEVAGGEQRRELGHHGIHDGTGGHQQHHRAGRLQATDEAGQVGVARHGFALAFLGQQGHFGGVFVVARNREMMVGQVQQQVAAHRAKANHAEGGAGGRVAHQGRRGIRGQGEENRRTAVEQASTARQSWL